MHAPAACCSGKCRCADVGCHTRAYGSHGITAEGSCLRTRAGVIHINLPAQGAFTAALTEFSVILPYQVHKALQSSCVTPTRQLPQACSCCSEQATSVAANTLTVRHPTQRYEKVWQAAQGLTVRFMLPTRQQSDEGPHTARKGIVQRPVLLLWEILSCSDRPFLPSHTRMVLSRDKDSTLCAPVHDKSPCLSTCRQPCYCRALGVLNFCHDE